jgi:hypothetical protein
MVRIETERIVPHYGQCLIGLASCLALLIVLIAVMRGTGVQLNLSATGAQVTIEDAMKSLSAPETTEPSKTQQLRQITLVIAIFVLMNLALALAAIWLSFHIESGPLTPLEKRNRLIFLEKYVAKHGGIA